MKRNLNDVIEDITINIQGDDRWKSLYERLSTYQAKPNTTAPEMMYLKWQEVHEIIFDEIGETPHFIWNIFTGKGI